MHAHDENWRKAAVLIASLDPADAEALCEALSPEEAAELRRAAGRLTDVDDAERLAVLDEFLGRRCGLLRDDAGGVELDDDLARRLARSDDGTNEACEAEADDSDESLADVDPAALVRCLAGEQLQTVAVVLARLPAPRVAVLLKLWPESERAALIDRISASTTTDGELVREIEQELWQRLRRDADEQAGERRRAATFAAILAAADEPLRAALAPRGESPAGSGANRLTHVGDEAGESTVLVRRFVRDAGASPRGDAQGGGREFAVETTEAGPPDAWARVARLDDETLALVLASADPQTVRLALAGADPALLDRLRRHLGARAARLLDRQLNRLDEFRLRDIWESQRRLGELAARLSNVERRGSSGPPR